MEKRSIYLDDQRIPLEHPENKEWVVVTNYEDFCLKVTEIGIENIDIVSFDHDLDRSATLHFLDEVRLTYSIDYRKIKEKTGMHAAMWICNLSAETCQPLPLCFSHSANPIGAANIIGYINLFLKNRKLPQNCIRVKWAFEKRPGLVNDNKMDQNLK